MTRFVNAVMPDYFITWLHLIATMALVGGMIFSQFMLASVLKHAPRR